MNTKNTLKQPFSNDDSLALYYKDIEGTRILTAQEERGLILQYHTNKDLKARDLIIQGALRYVIAEARKRPRALRDRAILQDLIAAGNIGLIRALNKFDPDVGTRFLTYAGWWVRHEMREEGRRLGLLHIPAHALAKGVKSPTTIELTESLAKDPVINDCTHQVNTAQSVVKLLGLTSLSIRETFIVKTCYGIHTSPKTLKQIGKVLDITGERVRQLRESALTKLRSSATTHQIHL
jgi:RNA polymerase nonessential primary-like sigma factor